MESENDLPGYVLPHTIEQFLLRHEHERNALIEIVRAMTDEQITTPIDPQGWSVKDHLAHLTAWQAGMVALLRKGNRWQAMGLEPGFVQESEGFDAINARLYEHHRDEP